LIDKKSAKISPQKNPKKKSAKISKKVLTTEFLCVTIPKDKGSACPMSTTICRGFAQAFYLKFLRKGFKTMNTTVRMISTDSYKLWNGLDNRAFDFARLFWGLFLQDCIYHAIEMIKSYTQTEFVYLFMPWHRHAMG